MKSFSRLRQVKERTGVCNVTLWRWEKAGIFPKRRHLGPKLVCWDNDELDAWAKSRPVVSVDMATAKTP